MESVLRSYTRGAFRSPNLISIDDLVDHLFSLTDDEGVDEWMHRFWVESSMPSSNDQRLRFVTLFIEYRDAPQIEHIERVCV